MKKTLALAAAMLFAGQLVNAQTQKGTRNLGLDLNYYSSKMNGTADQGTTTGTDYYRISTFTVGPTLGYFISDNLELGGTVSYHNSSQTQSQTGFGTQSGSKSSSNGVGVNAFIRKYVLYENKVGFRVGPYIGYGHASLKDESTSNFNISHQPDGTQTSYSAGATLDLLYYPSNRLGLAATLASANYSHLKEKRGDSREMTIDNWGISSWSRGLTLSVFYVFGAN